uniref:Putative serpin n=1 Tax=Helianthus annuus TaxID=4232 RepID=A0A251VDG2_HELAN
MVGLDQDGFSHLGQNGFGLGVLACQYGFWSERADEVADEVNLWAEKQTNGLIKQLLPANSVNNLTWLIFTNAIYFKGAWLEKFNRSSTADADFHLLDGSTVTVPFMTNGKTQFVCQYDGFKVLQLLYLQGKDHREFAMYFYLPDKKDGLPCLVDKIRTTPTFSTVTFQARKYESGGF